MTTRQDEGGFRFLLPSVVAVAETTADAPDAALLPEERDQIARAVEKRRREFVTVRHCARRALARIGYAPVPILNGTHREPLWPRDVVGSMTHCDGYRAAAVARQADVAALGIDAEINEPLPEGVLGAVALDSERRALESRAVHDPAVAWDRLVFSAKESIYKAWFPLTGAWLDFHECDVSLNSATFTGRFLVDAPMPRIHGRWMRLGRHLLTVAVVLASPI